MTLFDFIYGIGSGVAFIMALVGLTAENNKMPEADRCYAGVIVCSLFCASLSWAIPIWWLGFEIYKKLIEQDKLKKENKNLYKILDVLNRQLDSLLKEDKENQQLKNLLKECRDEMNPYIELFTHKKTFEVLLTKIDEVLK